MAKIPKLKKKISAYVLGEEGKISKQALLALGAILGGASLGALLSAEDVSAWNRHTNTLTISFFTSNNAITATHAHHASHSSHSSY